MKFHFRTIFLLLVFTGICSLAMGQTSIVNSSFEGNPNDATMPTGWHSCKEGTTPDILPGPWGVVKEAFEGETFLGLITRENGTWESIEQRLSKPMKKGDCYSMSMRLAYTKKYAGYNLPLKLRIWGSGTKCGRDQLLAETKFIKHSTWEKYDFEFFPRNNINYLILEAHFADGVYITYKGNILIDDLSEITKCDRAMNQ